MVIIKYFNRMQSFVTVSMTTRVLLNRGLNFCAIDNNINHINDTPHMLQNRKNIHYSNVLNVSCGRYLYNNRRLFLNTRSKDTYYYINKKYLFLLKMTNDNNTSTSCGHIEQLLDGDMNKNFQKTIEDNENVIRTLGITEDEGIWIFGYGSLMWKVNFEYSDTKIGFLQGFKRRFWQGSTDHRGTHDMPGRVATLVPTSTNEKLWGKAYFVPPELVKTTLDILNFREKGGYSLTNVPFTPRSRDDSTVDTIIQVILYVAIKGNSDHVGEEPLEDIAIRISKAVGPSGPNVEYLYNLAKTLEENNIVSDDDEKHTIELRNRVELLLENNTL